MGNGAHFLVVCKATSEYLVQTHQALEEGEDLQELAERARGKKDRRMANKLLRDAEASGSVTPFSDSESRGRKVKKGKTKMGDYEPITPANSKRKRGLKSLSVTPSVHEDEEDDRDSVMVLAIYPSSVLCH